MPCVFGVIFKESLDFFVILGKPVYKILVLGNPLLKSGRCLWRLSSSLLDHLNGVPFHLIGCRYQWWRLVSCFLVSAWRHPVSLVLPCLVVALQAECAGSVCWQQASDLSSSLHSLCHSDILSVLPSYYDIINEMPVFGARMHPWRLVASWQLEESVTD